VIILNKDIKLWVNTQNVESNYVELIPFEANKFNASVLPSPISFTKDASGKVTGFVDYGLDPDTFMKN